jgi:YHS domain-containing protein
LTAKSEAKKTPATPATWESAPAPAKAPVATRAIPEEEAAASVQRRSAPMPAETTVGKATVEASTTFVGAPALEETLELTDESSEGWHSVSSDGVEPCGPRCLADRTGQIAARRGQVGLMGFCPVALRDEQKLVDALPQHVAEYQSQKYQFSTAEAVEKFRADPERYLPAAGGLDVVAVGQGTAVALGSLEHAVWFRHKLYLFLTRENMELFRTQARQFAVQQ